MDTNQVNEIWGNTSHIESKQDDVDVLTIEDTTTPTAKGIEANKKLDEIFKVYKKKGDYRKMLDDLTSDICPIRNQRDPSWEEAAQNFFKAACLSLLHNSKVKAENFTIGRIKIVCGNGDFCKKSDGQYLNYIDNDSRIARLFRYFQKQPLDCRQLADAVVSNAPRTAQNFLGVLYTCFAQY